MRVHINVCLRQPTWIGEGEGDPKPMARSLAACDAMHSAGFAGGKHDPVASLIMCAPSVGWVDMSVINGDIVVKDGKLQTLDMQVLIHASPRIKYSPIYGCN